MVRSSGGGAPLAGLHQLPEVGLGETDRVLKHVDAHDGTALPNLAENEIPVSRGVSGRQCLVPGEGAPGRVAVAPDDDCRDGGKEGSSAGIRRGRRRWLTRKAQMAETTPHPQPTSSTRCPGCTSRLSRLMACTGGGGMLICGSALQRCGEETDLQRPRSSDARDLPNGPLRGEAKPNQRVHDRASESLGERFFRVY